MLDRATLCYPEIPKNASISEDDVDSNNYKHRNKMILGIGTDIVHISRIQDLLTKFGDKFISRILSPNEISAYNSGGKKISFLAKRFAAKEAVSKALGTGIGTDIEFKDIVISNNEAGGPIVTIDRDIAVGKNILISIADEVDVAVAFAVVSR